ncbi:DUF748 domain-containing protein [Hymenobacter endophyticus]|uniref:AsmA-like C-terminal domain-containing protein n=1 Tax=Hymenobacter endophyticus TaxID=3076335 RepID=A0ABU3TM32_9BACT|nr:DUF748 domain-containing protein [Hymenobacter endophyticus]MDU0372429.1 hypothetical protein [Hymenobacter endophyticus]
MPAFVASSVSATPVRRHHWGRWLIGLLAFGALSLWGLLTFWLDPWLQRQAEQRVYTASQGRYRLHIGKLRTRLWPLGAEAHALHLRTVASTPDSGRLPRLELALGRVAVRGVSWGALLRRAEVPVDSIVLDSVAVGLQHLPAARSSSPLYAQLPVAGLRVGRLAVRHLHGSLGPAHRPTLQAGETSLIVADVRLSAAAAADSGRIGYAAAVTGQTRGLAVQVPGHTVRVGRLQLSSVLGHLLLDSLLLHPAQPINHRRSQTMRVSLVVPRLQLIGLDGPRLARQDFRADTLLVKSPRLALTLPAQKPPSLHTVLAAYLRSCRLGALVVTNGRVQVAGTELAPAVAGVELVGSGFQVLPRLGPPTDMYYARRWHLQTGKATATLDAPYYHMSWQNMQADTRAGSLRLHAVSVLPTLSVEGLARRKGHQAAHVSARFPAVWLSGFSFPAAVNQGELRAAVLGVQGAHITTRSDGRFPGNPRISSVTPEALGRLPFRFAVNQLRLRQASLTMLYRAPRHAAPGILQITRFASTLRNLSNDPARMSAARPLTGEASGWLQGQGRAQLTLQANLLDPAGRHALRGTFYSTPLAMLNSMTVPTLGLDVRSGQVHQIDFRMTLDQQAARGTMWGRYTNLKMQRLNRQNRPGVLHRLQTSVINGVFIRDNNPRRPGAELEPGTILSNRQRRFSVFSLWRQGLVSGLLNSAGVPKGLSKKLSEGQ